MERQQRTAEREMVGSVGSPVADGSEETLGGGGDVATPAHRQRDRRVSLSEPCGKSRDL